MIEKYLRIQASKEDLLHELQSFETWPQWWPGVQSVRVIRNESSSSVVELVVKSAITVKMTVEFTHSRENAIEFRQLTGWFKNYEGAWTLLTPPGSTGVTLKIILSVDSGLFVPRSRIQVILGKSISLFQNALNRRLQEHKGSAGPAQIPEPASGVRSEPGLTATQSRKLAHVFPTRKGLEIWIAGRRHLLKSGGFSGPRSPAGP